MTWQMLIGLFIGTGGTGAILSAYLFSNEIN